VEGRYAIALRGAGMSTESGIPDFRGPKGLWITNKEAEARAYQRHDLFLKDPRGRTGRKCLGCKGHEGGIL